MQDLHDLIEGVSGGRLSRREFLAKATALGLTATAAGSVLAACGTSASSQESGSPGAAAAYLEPAKPPQALYLFNWQNEIAPSNKTKFAQRYGVEIAESYFDDNEALLAKLKGGVTGYDLIVPTSYMVSIMIKTGLLLPLDLKLIPNLKNLAPSFQKLSYDPAPDGHRYSVPWLWGNCGIAVRTDKVSQPITSWSALWNPQYKGQIDMLGDQRETLGCALKLLGYSYNSTDEQQINAAADKLIEQKPLVRQYDSLNMKRNIVSGVPLVHTWNGDAYLAVDTIGADKVSYVLPQEGFSVWVDNLCIPKGAPNPYWAHKFIDFMCEPENAAELVNYVQYLSPNAAARPFIDKKILARTPDEQTMQRSEMLSDVGVADRLWNAAWQKVKSA